MSTEFAFGYCAYLAWLLAGLCDFICHRRTDLPRTSGVRESGLHLLQMALLGCAVTAVLAFEPTRSGAAFVCILVAAHAAAGYADSRVAFSRRRTVLPVEQHLHSVLDMAPMIALAWWMIHARAELMHAGWAFEVKRNRESWKLWIAVLVPAVALCVVPALLEFRSALLYRATPGSGESR